MGNEKRLPIEQVIEIVRLQLAQGGCASLAITGTSMRPMLWQDRDRVLLAPLTQYAKGDVILYRRENGKYVLHRVVKKQDGRCICCGDNQWEKEQITDNCILAVMTDFYRKGKKISATQRGYRLYVWLWTGMLPVRKPVLKLCRGLYRVFWKKK